jgi:uncharacterized protein (TIGR00251 family)
MIEVASHPEGVILPIRAQPGAKRSGVTGERIGALKVAVTAPAVDGRANEALIELVRDHFGLRRGQVVILAGHASRDKKLLLRGLTPEEALARLG